MFPQTSLQAAIRVSGKRRYRVRCYYIYPATQVKDYFLDPGFEARSMALKSNYHTFSMIVPANQIQVQLKL